jgi:hypothetical protein
MRRASLRDIEYIENRLLAPAIECTEAIERLREIGESEIAARLMSELAEFTEKCRAARRDFDDNRRAERVVGG